MDARREGLKVTCGVLVTDGERFVMGDAGHYWDIPKGRPDLREPHAAAAARELREETGIAVSPAVLVPLGLYDYRPDTDLVLYLHRVDALPDVATLACTAMVDDGEGPPFPELSRFEHVAWDRLEERATANMARCLRRAEPLARAAMGMLHPPGGTVPVTVAIAPAGDLADVRTIDGILALARVTGLPLAEARRIVERMVADGIAGIPFGHLAETLRDPVHRDLVEGVRDALAGAGIAVTVDGVPLDAWMDAAAPTVAGPR